MNLHSFNLGTYFSGNIAKPQGLQPMAARLVKEFISPLREVHRGVNNLDIERSGRTRWII